MTERKGLAAVLPVKSLSTYQAPKEAIKVWACPTCGAPKGLPCQRKDGSQAMEQHEERYLPLQQAHDAGFVFAQAQYEGIVSQYKNRVNTALRARKRGGPR